MTKNKAFLKWAGSKYNCLHEVLNTLSPAQRLIEPFTGSGVVFMNTNYPSYLMAEGNNDLILLFQSLQQQGTAFIDYCEHYFTPQTNKKEYYYLMRTRFNSLLPSTERAALFLYLNRHGYNGLCRYNSNGGYNVPFGLYVKPYFPRKEMLNFYHKCSDAQFMYQDFRHTFALAKAGDIIYCDPPYVPIEKQTKPLPYTQKKFNEADQIELATLAKETAAKGIRVIISNHDTEFTRTHYAEATIKSFPVARWINCQSHLRQPVKELLALF